MVIRVEHGDSREVLRTLAADSIDACVTDPPYSLVSIQKRFGKPGSAPCQEGADGRYRRASAGFMGKQWDTGETAFDPEFWAEVLRVLKPGAHLLAFGGTRSYHRLVCAIEDAGFEIRDAIMWHYGQGFPKSHDVSKGIDKAAGAEREVIGPKPGLHSRGKHEMADGWRRPWMDDPAAVERGMQETAPATEAARQWAGWGTALKPATEIICLARKPLSEGTVAANVLQHGTGAINVDGCRVAGEPTGERRNNVSLGSASGGIYGTAGAFVSEGHALGRWPANVIHDGSDEVMEAFARHGESASRKGKPRGSAVPGDGWGMTKTGAEYDDSGSPARFFYCAKASRSDRAGSKHPTVKPIALLRYLCRLITPPGGTVLDPFAGSGTLAAAAHAEGFDAILIEREAEYIADIRARIAALPTPSVPALEPQIDLFSEAA